MKEELTSFLLEEMRNLRETNTRLQADIKAKTIQLNGILENIQLARMTAETAIREAEVKQRDRIVELEQQRAPLEDAVATSTKRLQEQDALHAKRLADHQAALAAAQHEKLLHLQSLEKQISERTAQHRAIGEAIADCQRKVAEL